MNTFTLKDRLRLGGYGAFTAFGDEITFLNGRAMPTEDELAETDAAAYALWLAEQTPVKIWPDVAEFNAEFSLPEKMGIVTSQDPSIRLLDREMLAWRGPVHADDPQVIQGLDALQAAEILTPERRAEILA